MTGWPWRGRTAPGRARRGCCRTTTAPACTPRSRCRSGTRPGCGSGFPPAGDAPPGSGSARSRTASPAMSPAPALGEADGWVWWEAPMTVTNPVARYRFLLEVPAGQAGARRRCSARGRRDRRSVRRCGRGELRYWSLNAQGLFSRDVSDYADFRLTTFPAAPQWLRRGTMYQIFPDRFARSVRVGRGRFAGPARATARPAPDWAVPCSWDTTPVEGSGPQTPYQFYGGDLAGITEKLDHIQQLGADVVYLTPFFPARSNHRYDASTFASVDPLLGGDQALVELVEAAHARGPEGDGRPHRQPLRRRPRMVPARPRRTGLPRRRATTTSTTTTPGTKPGTASPRCPNSTGPRRG